MFALHRTRKGYVLGTSAIAAVAVLGVIAASPAAQGTTRPQSTVAKTTAAASASGSGSLAVGPGYNAAHVYVPPADVNTFVSSWEATFGGTNTTPTAFQITPVPSTTISTLLFSPVGMLSVYGYQTGIPYPWGQERVGDDVTSIDGGVADAERSGADLVVSPWADKHGEDVILQFPGGVNIQLYDNTPSLGGATLTSIPENRVYLEPQSAAQFIRDYVAFTRGRVTIDNSHANGAQIGEPGTTFREVLISGPGFGKTLVLITKNGAMPYPFGLDKTGYQVTNLSTTLAKATASGAHVLAGPYDLPGLETAIVEFPGGYITEIHQGGI
jgi:hypothetical protein